jgi:hypothetical protein
MSAHDKLLPLTFAAMTASAVFASACSSSSGGSGPGSVSSVDSTKTVNSLSDSEAKQYCEDANRYAAAQSNEADAKKVVCGLTAAAIASYGAETDAEAQTKCKAQYTECMNKPADTTDTDTDAGTTEDPCADFKSRAKDCSATVGEVNQCLADRAAAFKTLASKDYCAEAKVASPDAGTSSPLTSYDDPASCKALQAKCPSLTGSSDDSGGNTDG